AAFAKVHQPLVDRQTVRPGGKSRLATKAAYFAKELDENLLGEVFCFGDVLCHPQAKGIDATVVALVKLLEGLHVASGGSLRQLVIRSSVCLSFDCGHVLFCWGKPRR